MSLVAVDLFAGLGGFTEGAVQAGLSVAVALNHWDFAVEAHRLNHPDVRHVLQDARQAEWRDLPRFQLLMGGPACQGHSEAAQPTRVKSGRCRAKHDVDRATAWAMVDCAEVCRPRWVIAENVPAWLRWSLFPIWRDALHRLGYASHVVPLNAADYETPQARRRVFVVAALDAAALRSAVDAIEAAAKPTRIGVDSFARWDEGAWKPAEKCGAKSRARILAGLDLGADHWWCQHVTGHRGKLASAPLSTLTTADQHVLCKRDGPRVLYRTLLPEEMLAAQTLPETYRLPPKARRRDICRAIGNAVPRTVATAILSAVRYADARAA